MYAIQFEKTFANVSLKVDGPAKKIFFNFHVTDQVQFYCYIDILHISPINCKSIPARSIIKHPALCISFVFQESNKILKLAELNGMKYPSHMKLSKGFLRTCDLSFRNNVSHESQRHILTWAYVIQNSEPAQVLSGVFFLHMSHRTRLCNIILLFPVS